jgi:D-glycero-D-manno-heptose 1,7-bisphosphate phosphatase
MDTKLIVLDRDGVLNQERGEHTYRPQDLAMVEGIGEALALLAGEGFQFAVATNQSGIALGLYTLGQMHQIHEAIASYLGQYGVCIAAFYYCPHHPSAGKCLCRKPNSGMLERAVARLGAQVAQSWMIGDKHRDVEAGSRIGLNTLLIPSNSDLRPWLGQILGR